MNAKSGPRSYQACNFLLWVASLSAIARFFYLQLEFTPKMGHTFTDEREVVVEIPKNLVQRKSDSINESLKEVIALGLAKNAALGTFPTEEGAVNLFEARSTSLVSIVVSVLPVLAHSS